MQTICEAYILNLWFFFSFPTTVQKQSVYRERRKIKSIR